MAIQTILQYALVGATGTLFVPANQSFNEAQYFTFINNSPNTLSIFSPSSQPGTDVPALIIPPGASQEFIIPSACRDGFTIVYASPGNTKTFPLNIYITSARTNISASNATAYASVQLAKLDQLPPALTAAGNLKVALEENIIGSLPVSVLDSEVTIPMTVAANNTAVNLTQAGVPGKSYYISYLNWRVSGTAAVGAANLPVLLKDGANTIYSSAIPAASANGANLSITFPQPIKITAGNSVSYTIAASGTAGCIVYANMGLILK